jgi:hypothetical protein
LLMHEGAIVTSKNKILPVAGVLLVTGAIAGGLLYAYWDKAVPLAGMAVNYVRTFTAPSGTTTTEEAAPSASAKHHLTPYIGTAPRLVDAALSPSPRTVHDADNPKN